MKVEFLRDFGSVKKGEQAEVSEKWALYGLRAAICKEINEPEQVEETTKPAKKSKAKKQED